MLERFRLAQQAEVNRLKLLEKTKAMPAPYAGPRPSFAARLKAMGPGAIIAEYKRASPSHGEINLELSPEGVAAGYAAAGAAAISVLTEKEHFMGELSFIERMAAPGLPLLRKDFLIHPLQAAETASTPASALLLIARMLDEERFLQMLERAVGYGLEAVLEVFDRADLDKTRRVLEKTSLEQPIIQVNNRDLKTLTVSDAPSRELIKEKGRGEIWISASGASTASDVRLRADLGFDAVLVGASLMRGENPSAALAALRMREETS